MSNNSVTIENELIIKRVVKDNPRKFQSELARILNVEYGLNERYVKNVIHSLYIKGELKRFTDNTNTRRRYYEVAK